MALIWLDEIGSGDRARVGGKAFVLGRLRQAGFPVPDGFVLAAGGSWGPAEKEAAARFFRRLGGPVAVRSSGTAEDGAAASFAGQYLTLLDVRDEAALLDAIERCRASEQAAGAYAGALATRQGAMGVLVQRFIEPRAAGVVFTRDPRDASRLLVEAHAGRGEELVSGRVRPARYSVGADGVRADGAFAVLTTEEVGELAALARRVEAHLEGPQDVEWAWDASGLALVQSRPITVDAPEAMDPRLGRLTRANVGEVLPGPVTPLTHSAVAFFLEEVFQRITRKLDMRAGGDLGSFLVLYRRRLYFNLDLCIDMVTRLPGVTAEDAERLILGGGAMSGQGASFRGRPRLKTVLGALSMGRGLPSRIEEAERIVAALPDRAAVRGASAPELARWIDEMTERCVVVGDTHVSTSGASAVSMALLTRLLQRDGKGDPVDRTARLLAGLDGIDSVAPATALETIAARARAHAAWRDWLEGPGSRDEMPDGLRVEIDEFLARFGHRGVAEGDLSARSWDEDPAPVFDALRALLRHERSPGFGSRSRSAIRFADEEALVATAGLLGRPLVSWAIRSAQTWVRRREHTKSLSVTVIRHARRLVQAAARRLVEQGALPAVDLVDFLTLAEVRAALAGAPVPVAEAQRRRRRHAAESRLPAPREVDLRRPDVEPSAAPVATGEMQGIGVSAGVAVGPARVALSPETSVQPGEILVTSVLDAGLSPLLATASAAVAEIGGILSHGSVVAREMGVPCVVDVRDATRHIRDGEMVMVDGGTGRVRVLPAAAAGGATATGLPPIEAVDDTAEGLHPLENHPRARESVYFNMRDVARGIGIVFSMAVRPGGRGEALLTLSLPDGRVLFGLTLGAAQVDAGGFAVGGFRLDWHPLRLTLDTEVAAHEGSSFPPPPIPLLLTPGTVRVQGTLALEPTTSAVDFSALLSEDAREWMRPLGSHHVEQSGRWRGELQIDGVTTPFDGRGSRDHSWGRREWSAADYWRLFMAPISDELAVHALITSARGRLVTGGVVWRDGSAEAISRVEYAAIGDVAGRPRSFELELQTASGPLRLQGTVEHTVSIPVDPERRLWRHLTGRPYALVLHENFTRYEVEGQVGYGMAEITERPR